MIVRLSPRANGPIRKVKGCQFPMARPHRSPLLAAGAAIAVGFTICAAAVERIEHVSTQTEFSPLAAGPSPSVDIDAALDRVAAARSRAGAAPLAPGEAPA